MTTGDRPDVHPTLLALGEIRDRAGLFLDFDGTLSPIVSRPELARPLPGALALLARLARTFALVAVVSGRAEEELISLLPVEGLTRVGLYGMDGSAGTPPIPDPVRRAAIALAGRFPGVRVEDKGVSLAVHFRGVAGPDDVAGVLAEELRSVAARHGLAVLPGKKVLELAPDDLPGKGSVVRREVRARGLAGCLYAGDDQADRAAFDALDDLRETGILTLKVAVASDETPQELMERADLTVRGPEGLVDLLEGAFDRPPAYGRRGPPTTGSALAADPPDHP